MTSFCDQACIICDIDGFTGRNGAPVPNWDQPNNFCAPIAHNLRWIGFIAGSTSLTLDVAVSNCNGPFASGGLQMGLYQANDCNIGSSGPISNCDNRVQQGNSAILTSNVPLVVGQYYFLVIDGRNNDICDYTVSVVSGSTLVPPVTMGGGISGPATSCPGVSNTFTTNPVPGAPNYYWYVNNVPQPGNSTSTNVTFPSAGTYQVCVEASNTCSTSPQECTTVVVQDIPPTTINGVTCPGNCFQDGTLVLCNPGSFSYNFTSSAGCDSIVTYVITQLNTITRTFTGAACAGQTTNIRGVPYGPGTYTVNAPGVNGECDSTLTINVSQLPAPNTSVSDLICQGDTYTFGTQVLSSGGTYTEIFAAANGCDSTVTLTLTVENPPPGTDQASICAGQTFPYGTQVLSTPGSYTEVFQTANGCDSSATLTLTVVQPTTTTLDREICTGQSVQVGTNSYSTTGTYTDVLLGAAGCDSTVVLNLTVNQPVTESVTASICAGQTFPFDGSSLSTSGTYTATFLAANGCDSTVTLNLTVVNTITTNLDETICAGQTYPFDGTNLGAGGVYTANLTSAAGCDSVVTLTLTIAPNPLTNLTETICDGDSYTVGTSTYTTAGTYTDVLTSAAGCDSTVVLDLSVDLPSTTPVSASICAGNSYAVGSSTFTTTGQYTVSLTSANGCDSTVLLDLTVNPDYFDFVDATICIGDSYTVGTNTFTTPGTYLVDMLTVAGCDSSIQLTLNVVGNVQETVTATICAGDSYPFNGVVYTSTGLFSANLTSVNGCDSTAFLDLTVVQPAVTNLSEVICTGESFTVGSQTFNSAGNYTVNLLTSNGCDSTVNLDLTVFQTGATTDQVTLCPGSTYDIGGTTVTRPGSYTFTLQTAQGCDSIVNLTVLRGQSYNLDFTDSFCPGTPYNFAGNTYFTSGFYTVNLTTVNGCDSTLTLTLTEDRSLITPVSATICQGQSYAFGGNTLTTAGTYNDFYTTLAGCDSTVILTLTVVDDIQTSLAETICAGEDFAFDGRTLTATGTYSATYASSGGCDSVVTLDLTVSDPVDTTRLVERLCATDPPVTLGPQTFDQTGFYTVSLLDANGCDSTITLDLYVTTADTTELTRQVCAGTTVSVGGQDFTATGTYVVDLPSRFGCDSTIRLALTVANEVLLQENASLCSGDVFTYRGEDFSTAGTFTRNFPGTGGECDTVVTIIVNVNQPASTALAETICAGDSYFFDGADRSTAGTYTANLSTSVGCDSTVTLVLTVADGQQTTLNVDLCAGETYPFGTANLGTSGTYVNTFLAADGCDSVVTLNLAVSPPLDTLLRVSICSGESYTVGTQTFSADGTYTVVLPANNSCDSTITLELTVDTQVALSQSEALCTGETVTVRGTDYTTGGSYSIAIPGLAGDCDTLLSLTIVEATPSRESLSATICDGENYPFDGGSLTTAGTYTATLTNAAGCDSVVTLTLDVLPATSNSVSATICAGELYTFDNRDYTTSGTYTATFAGANGCDSTVTLALTVLDPLAVTVNQTICDGSSYTVGSSSFSVSGTYTIPLTSAANCDSIVTLNLNVVDEILVQETASLCAGQQLSFGGQQISAAGTYSTTDPSSAGCDSTTTLTVSIADTIRTGFQISICRGDTYDFGGSTLSDAGTYTDRLLSSGGCDSVSVLTLLVIEPSNTVIARTICSGESTDFAGQTYTASGTYSATLVGQAGCDSTVSLELTVVDTLRENLTVSICSGQSYLFDGSPLTLPGTYRAVNTSAAGCDSVTTLQLSVADTLRENLTVDLCAGDSYPFGGIDYSSSGTYQQNLTASSGCDSVVTLSLSIANPITASLDSTICPGDVIRIGGQEFRDAGTFQVVLQAANGCDSTLALTVTVTPCGSAPLVSSTDVLCFGESSGSLTLDLSGVALPVDVALRSNQVTLDTMVDVPSYTFRSLPAGNYTLLVNDAQNQDYSLSAEVDEPEAPVQGELTLTDYNGYALRCEQDGSGQAAVSVTGGKAPYDYLWSNGSRDSSIRELQAGLISVQVTDENDCPWDDSATLTEPEPPALDLDVTPAPCDELDLGGSIVATVAGGLGPYRVQLNDELATPLAPLEGLRVGTYDLTVIDSFGCTAAETVEITAPESPKLELGRDREIVQGDTVTLDVQSTTALVSWEWDVWPSGYLSCDTCATTQVAPEFTSTYTVIGTTADGCTAEEEINLRVRIEDVVFAPNGFSPNEDGRNDNWTLFVQDEGATILELRVFDRWGEAIWSRFNFEPGREDLGWDGRFRGEVLNPAVFVFYGRVRLRSGREVEVKGDLSLVK